jgi:hypothetical protein
MADTATPPGNNPATTATAAGGAGGSSSTGNGGTATVGAGGGVVDGGKSDSAGGAGQGSPDAGHDDASDGGAGDGATAGDPMLLSQTGLYANIATGELAAGVQAYQPQFALWSDSATKRRWIKLPPGTKIDTTDMNYWDFPIDTKLFKEFTRGTVRVETRMIWKHGQGDWFMMAYKWNAQQNEAVAVPMGEMNASGTQHDIPAQEGCTTCHGSMKDRVLGFTAIQLSHNLGGGLNLTQASAMGWFTTAPPANLVVPGDAIDKAALGYLHANCGLCHNDRSKIFQIKADINVWLDTSLLATVAETPSYTTLVNRMLTGSISQVPTNLRVAPGNAAGSAVHELMALRGDAMRQMPPTGTEMVDTVGLAAVDAWINRLPRSDLDAGRDR